MKDQDLLVTLEHDSNEDGDRKVTGKRKEAPSVEADSRTRFLRSSEAQERHAGQVRMRRAARRERGGQPWCHEDNPFIWETCA